MKYLRTKARDIGNEDDPFLDRLHAIEKRFFAGVVFAAKLITWSTLLAVAAVIEFSLIAKVAKVELDSGTVHAESSRTCTCSHRKTLTTTH